MEQLNSVDIDPAPPRAAEAALPFPVVAIGASAGGLEALEQFFQNVPAASGMAFVVVQHLSPEHQSALAAILAGRTPMPVREITDGMPVKVNEVYVIAPGFTLTLREGRLRLGEPVEKRGHRRPVDDFLRSLAEHQQTRSIAVILSGTGANGTAGAQAIKAAGGICIAQQPDSAAFPSMPSSLIHAGYADQVLEPGEIPNVLLRYIGSPYVGTDLDARRAEERLERDAAHFREVLAILRGRTRRDFAGYRKPTLLRRIQRRMGLSGISELAAYAVFLRHDPAEVTALGTDLMINVTGFFRDPDAWEALRTSVIAPLCAAKGAEEPIRAWVPACASGEEAYTLGILIAEEYHARGKDLPDVKIFATDTAEKSLSLARAGVFPGGIESELTPERLERYFDKDEHTFRIKKRIRDLVVFAPQDILRDPPFSRIDLCTCRNLLIYLEHDTQRRVISLLNFALRPGGYLFLGNTESAGHSDHVFESISRRWRIYRKASQAQHKFAGLPRPEAPGAADTEDEPAAASELQRPGGILLLQRALLERFGPPTVVVDKTEQVVYFHGATNPYLQQPAGEPTRHLMQLLKPALRLLVQSLLRAAARDNKSMVGHAEVHEPVSGVTPVEIIVEPLIQTRAPEYFLISFRKRMPQTAAATQSADDLRCARSEAELHEEVRVLRSELQNTIETYEVATEELKASQEEAASINEELQSTNEELETGKEELQSINEELLSANRVLQARVAELEVLTRDVNNLLGSTEIAVLFLDCDFRVRRFTAAVSDLLKLIPEDVGRPLTDLAPKFADPHLLDDAREVIARLTPIQREMQSHSGRLYLRRTLPYLTQADRVGGVVMTFTDITSRQ